MRYRVKKASAAAAILFEIVLPPSKPQLRLVVPPPAVEVERLPPPPPIPRIGPAPKRRGRAPSYIPDEWSDLEWENHPAARRAVADHPAGMTLEEIGACMGITRERVRQIEHTALKKLAENGGSDIAWLGQQTVAIPECKRCGDSFVRKYGRQIFCEPCDELRKKKRRISANQIAYENAQRALQRTHRHTAHA